MRPSILALSLAVLVSAAGAASSQPCRGRGTRPSDSKPASGTITDLAITPNPWRSDRNSAQLIKFSAPSGLSSVLIYTAAGKWVRTIDCSCLLGNWDLLNDAGQPVKSGVYIYVARDAAGRQARGTLAILR